MKVYIQYHEKRTPRLVCEACSNSLPGLVTQHDVLGLRWPEVFEQYTSRCEHIVEPANELEVLRTALVAALAGLACETDSDTIAALLHDAAEKSANPAQARKILSVVWAEAAVVSGHAWRPRE